MSETVTTIPTGVEGLDELISGGLPKGRVILVVGGPGAGKTILASQFLYKGITDFNENAVLVAWMKEKSITLLKWQNSAGTSRKRNKKENSAS